MNRLSPERRCAVVEGLCEGLSIRSTSRITGVAKRTILRLIRDLGEVASDFQDRELRNLTCRRIECDEIWSFCYAKEDKVPPDKQGQFGYGDVWNWTAMDPDSKLIVTWLVGDRSSASANALMADLAPRLKNRIQLTTDGLFHYPDAVDLAFGGEVDYGVTIKSVKGGGDDSKIVYSGQPDQKLISTSMIERQNLTLRMSMRRFARLTNAHSKKVENHAADLAMHFLHYNYVRPHESLSGAVPAQAAGLIQRSWRVRDMVRLLEVKEAGEASVAPLPGLGDGIP